MKPMFTLHGQVVHVFEAPKGISKKTGEEYGGQDKVQVMGNIPLDNGQHRMELITLTTDQGSSFQKLVGRPVSLPVAFYVSGRAVGYYIPKGHSVAPQNSSETTS
jgi:hypothetical protein